MLTHLLLVTNQFFSFLIFSSISELQNQGRKKRDVQTPKTDFFPENGEDTFETNFDDNIDDRNNFDYREAVLSGHSLFRGFSNSLAAADSHDNHVKKHPIKVITI